MPTLLTRLYAARGVQSQAELDKSYDLNRAAVDSAREAARLAQVRYRLGSTLPLALSGKLCN